MGSGLGIHFDSLLWGWLVFNPVKFYFNLFFIFLFFLISFLDSSWAQSNRRRSQAARLSPNPIVREIKVEGLKKLDAGAVLSRIKAQKNQNLDPQIIREDILTLFKMGFFSDIQVSLLDSGLLVYSLVEKPTLVEIKIEGASDVKEEELKEAVGIKPFEILDAARIQTGVEKIQKFYEGKGYFLAKVESIVEDVIKGESVRVVFRIQEGEKVKVQKISFLGNKLLKEDFLKSRLVTSEGSYFSFMSSSGSFKQEAFERDLQVLRLTYLNEGFIQAKIDRPQVSVTPDRRSIYITYRIEEGERFQLGDIDFAGDLLFSREELNQDLEISKLENFSYEAMQKDLIALQAKYGDLGYAYANVIPRTRINEREKIVDITFEFDKGNKVYFGQFSIVGNLKTRDRVIRRELRILEGELYNETRRRRSLENIQRLGFFEEVNFKTSSNPDTPDKMDIEIVVKERNTGSLQLGAGFGSSTGFNMNGSINQSNFLGKGQRLSAAINFSDLGSYYNLNFTEPNFDDSEWLLGFDVYQSGIDRYEYEEKKLGGAVKVGRTIGDNLVATLRYELDRSELLPYYDKKNNIMITDLTLFPLDQVKGVTSSLTGILEYDSRNDRFSPSKGHFASTSIEFAGLGGDIQFTKTNITYRYFKNLFWDVVWRNNLTHSYLMSHKEGEEPPFNERFLLGGPYSLRGYRFYRVGKTAFSQQTYDRLRQAPYSYSDDKAYQLSLKPIGGTQQLMFQTELEFPMIKEAGIKGAVFYDIGLADDIISQDNFYSDIGFGFRWFSPIGPLRFEWGFPLKEAPASPDRVNFDFSIGSAF